MSENKAMMAKDVSAPVRRITLDGVQYELVFNNRFMRECETVYDADYGTPKPVTEIFREMHAGLVRAMYAIYYAAARAGGLQMTFRDFEMQFSFMDVEGLKELLTAGINESLPDPEKN